MALFEYIITIYNSITNIIEEMKIDAANFLHKYLGIDE
jgi:hypothetical protein